MQKGVEEEDFWNKEIDVEEENSTLKGIFKSDYERTKDLDRTTIYVSAEWSQIVRLLKKRLRHNKETQQGVHFIRRRLAITGLQLLQDDNNIVIMKQQEEYNDALEVYNPLTCILAAQVRNIYPREALRTSLYLQEETLGWIQDFSDMFNLNTYSIIRPAFSYTILKLIDMDFLPGGFDTHAKYDIELFKQYISRKI